MTPPDLRARLQRLRRPHVRIRVTVAAALVAAVAGGLGSVAFVIMLRGNLEQAVVTSARQQADALDAQLRSGTTPQEAVVSGQDDVVTQIVDGRGRLVASDRPSLTRPLRTAPGLAQGVPVAGPHDRYTFVATRSADGYLIVVGRSEEHVGRAGGTATTLLLVSVPLGVLLVSVVVWLSIGRALRPVEAMRRQATEISSEQLHRRLPVPGGTDEIALLADTLNAMLDRIDSAQQVQRQFIADASHELRSPLAAMRQLMEVAAHYPGTMTTQELAAEVLPEEQRMEELVTALLMLARLDDAGGSGLRALVDLDDIVVEEISRVRSSGCDIHVDASGVDAAQVRGDPVLLAHAVRNLLSNAVRHGVEGVSVSLTEDDVVQLVVEDDGNGVAIPERQRIFERFVRLDEARNRDHGGTGLGLSIVRKVVQGAGGTVDVSEAALGGARFTVTLRRDDAGESTAGRTSDNEIRPGADAEGGRRF